MADAVIGQVKAVLTADTKGLDTGLQRASSRLASFGKSATQVGKTLSTRLTLPLVAAGAAAVKTAADFEKSMASIVGLVGVAADEVKAMEDGVRSMAKQFGSSASEAANALFFITSAGLRGSDATNTLAASLKASAVGLGDVSTIADLATSALNAYGSDTLSATAATDVLTAAVREGKLEAAQLAGSMGGVLPIASAMGVQFHEVGAAFAALSRTGTNAAEATTQINGILSALLKPTMQAEKALRTMGLSSEFLRDNLRNNGLLDTLMLLSEEFDGNAAATASVFGNVRALKGVMDLMGANVEGTIAIFDSMADTTGTVDAAFEVMAETASFKFSKAMAEAKDSLLTVGQAAMPIATQAAEALAAVLGTLGDLFGSLGEGTQQIIVSLGGVAAIAGPVALAVGGVAKAIGAMTAAAAAHPVLAAMTVAITGVAVVMGQIRAEAKKAAERQETLTEAFKEAGDPATVVIDKLKAIAESMSLISGAAKPAEQDFSEFLGDVVLMTELASLEATGAFGKLGEAGQDALRALAESDTDLRSLGFVTNVQDMATALDLFEAGVNDNVGAAGELAAELYLLADSGDVTVEELDAILIALDRTNQAYRDHHKTVAENNKEYVTSGEIFEDFSGIINDDLLASLVAGAEETGNYTRMLEELNTHAAHAAYIQSLLAPEIDSTETRMSSTAMTANDMARALSEAGDMAGYDKRQLVELTQQLGILDQIDPSVMVELGLDIMGGEQVLALVDKLIAIQGADFFKTGLPEFGVPAALQGLMDLRTALELALDEPISTGGGGGGSAAGNSIENFIDRTAEYGQRLLTEDFAKKLFEGTPESIQNTFRRIMDDVARFTGDNIDQSLSALLGDLQGKFSRLVDLAGIRDRLTNELSDIQRAVDNAMSKVALSLNYDRKVTVFRQAQSQAFLAKRFVDTFRQLAGLGLPASVLSDVVNAGLNDGYFMARELLSLSPERLAEFKSFASQIESARTSAGQIVADMLGQAEVETELDATNKAMQDLTSAIQNDLADAFDEFLVGLGATVDQLIGGGSSGGGAGGGTPTVPVGGSGSFYTVKSGDSMWAIATALLGSGARWTEIARANGFDPAGYGNSWAIQAGQQLQIPARAMGGSVSRGRPYLVGELGPELFVPGASGFISPNGSFGGGSTTMNVTVNMPAGSNGDDVVRALRSYQKHRGGLPVQTLAKVR